ncbi:MAG: hypothetical protein IIX27_03605 [Ruminococcus sp.]|nr:hypothetical protein [Ruminococcus sp.]
MKKTKHHSEHKTHKRTSEQKAATRKLTSRIVIGVTVALMFIFIVFIFVTTNFMGSDGIITEVTYKTIAHDTINTTGFVIRDEECIKNASNGVLVYQVENGEKITANGVIANVYKDEADAVNYQKICSLEEEIADLKELNSIMGASNVGLDSVNNKLDQRLTSFIECVNKRDFNAISDNESELLSAIYRKQIITGDQKNFDEQIAKLESEKESLENNNSGSTSTITTKDSGYFVSDIDGYESAFSVDELSQIKSSDLEKVKPIEFKPEDYVGKVIKGVNWYIACPITQEEAVAINHSNSDISIRIPYATSESIPVKVISVNQFSNEKKAVAILECNFMNPALAKIRSEAIEIQLNTYEGLKVSKKALHDSTVDIQVVDTEGNEITKEAKVQGVYVKYGDQLIFKQIFIIYSGEDYVICSEQPGENAAVNVPNITLYDEVVVEGDDLYYGKLIN